jgi:hypothetical protein
VGVVAHQAGRDWASTGLANRQGVAPAELEADLGLDDVRVEQPAARRIIAEHWLAERKVPV